MIDPRRLADEWDKFWYMPGAHEQIRAALRSAADENDRLREALREGVAINDGCLFDATVSAALDEWADRHRALLAVPEPCAECGENGFRQANYQPPSGTYTEWRPCPVCAVPTKEA